MGQSFFLKHQARSWAAVRGQPSTVKVLKNDIVQGKVRNVAFVGPKGVGKTTLAGLLAHSSLCLGPACDGSPCGSCVACRQFVRGANRDLHKINCPLHGRPEHVSALLNDDLEYRAQNSRRRVVILDEAGKLPFGSQQMLLNPLQSDDANRPLFIFTLLDADALEPPLRDRLRIFELNAPSVDDAVEYLDDLAAKENLKAEHDAFRLIASFARDYRALADGLEKVADVCGGRVISADDVREHLLRGHAHQILSILGAAARLDLQTMLEELGEWR